MIHQNIKRWYIYAKKSSQFIRLNWHYVSKHYTKMKFMKFYAQKAANLFTELGEYMLLCPYSSLLIRKKINKFNTVYDGKKQITEMKSYECKVCLFIVLCLSVSIYLYIYVT